MSCGVSHRCGLDPALLWLWCRLQLQLYAVGEALKSKQASKQTNKQKNRSYICDLHHSSWQHQILNPLSEIRDQTHILMDTSWVRYC